MTVWPIIRKGAVAQHPRAQFAEQIAPRLALLRSGQRVGRDFPKNGKFQKMLT